MTAFAIDWSVAMQMGNQVGCDFPLSTESHFPALNGDLLLKEGRKGVDVPMTGVAA